MERAGIESLASGHVREATTTCMRRTRLPAGSRLAANPPGQRYLSDPAGGIDRVMGRKRPPQLVPPLVEPHGVPASPRDRNEVARRPGEPAPRPAKSTGAAVVRAVLGPPDGPTEPRWPEIVRAKHLVDERAQWAFPCAKHVVHGKDGAAGEVGTKQSQVLFHRGVVVVAVNPEEPDWLAPGAGELAREHATRVDRFRDTRALDVREEVVVGRALAA